jgi:hypothetical protein
MYLHADARHAGAGTAAYEYYEEFGFQNPKPKTGGKPLVG